MGSERLLLVDGTAVAYRSFYAIQNLSTSDGRATNALFGFIRTLQQQRRMWEPTHMAVVFDGGLPVERTTRLESYKAQREEMPSDLVVQMDAIEEYLQCADMPAVRMEGEEADDVMATLAMRAVEAGMEVLLASSDKDMLQIVSDEVNVVEPLKAGRRMGPDEVRGKLGVEPRQVADWLALVGDAVDNIPGVPGVGPKTAARLLQAYGSIDGIWRHLAEIRPERIRERLAENRDAVERNLEVVRLRTDLKIPISVNSLKVREEDQSRTAPFYEKYELRSFLSSR